MDTSTGRFISMDTYQGSTADPISLYKYLYAHANPVSNSDPSGYTTKRELDIGMACGSILDAAYHFLSSSALAIGRTLISSLRLTSAIVGASPLGLVIPLYMFADIASGLMDSSDVSEKAQDDIIKQSDNNDDDDDNKHGYVLYDNYIDFKKDSPKGKPLFSPTPKKWFKKGGMIGVNYDTMVWTYIANVDGEMISVDYIGGFPDFKGAGLVIDEYIVEGGI